MTCGGIAERGALIVCACVGMSGCSVLFETGGVSGGEECLPQTLFADDYSIGLATDWEPIEGTTPDDFSVAFDRLRFNVADGEEFGLLGPGYPLRESAAIAELNRESLDGSARIGLQFEGAAGSNLHLVVPQFGTAVCELVTSNQTVPCDNPAGTMLNRPRFTQVRLGADHFYVEGSDDGAHWTLLGELSKEEVSAGETRGFVAAVGADMQVGVVEYERFSFEAPPVGGWCSLSRLVDAFSEPDLGPLWRVRLGTVGSAEVSFPNEELLLSIPRSSSSAGDPSTSLTNSTRFLIDGAGVQFESIRIREAGPASTAAAGVAITSHDFYQFRVKDDLLEFVYAGMVISSVPFLIPDHANWRLEFAGGVARWLTAPDGATPPAWTEQETLTMPRSGESAQVRIELRDGAGALCPNPEDVCVPITLQIGGINTQL